MSILKEKSKEEVISPDEQKKLEEANEILKKQFEKKSKLFMDEYKQLCEKHGMQIQPQVHLILSPLK